MVCNVQENIIKHFKDKKYINENFIVTNALFFKENNDLSNLARDKYSVVNDGKIFNTETLSNTKVKAVLNEPFINELQTKHTEYYNAQEAYQIDTPITTDRSSDFESVLEMLKKKFNIEYKIVNQPEVAWKGKFQNGIVYINSAKNITVDTPFHEYLHPLVFSIKKDNRELYDKLINELKETAPGEINNIRSTPEYNNLTEEELLEEALVSRVGKLASEPIKPSLYKRIVSAIKSLFRKLFGFNVSDFNLDMSLRDLADFMSSSNDNIDLSGARILGSYYQIDDKTKKYKNFILSKSNPLQQRIIDQVLPDYPENPIELRKEDHVYINTRTGETYTSVTTKIKGKLESDTYQVNRDFGNAFDKILQDLLEGKAYDDIFKELDGVMDEKIARQAYESLRGYIVGLTEDGSVVIPQLVVGDHVSKIAGSLDLLVISPTGEVTVLDLKVSKNSVNTPKYDTKYNITNEGSLFVGDALSTRQQHGIQVGTYAKMIKNQGIPVKGTKTIHILLRLNKQDDKTVIKDFNWEKSTIHSETQNKDYIDKVIPQEPKQNKVAKFKKDLGLDNPANDPDFLTAEEAEPEEDMGQDTLDALRGTVKQYVDKLRLRKAYLDNLRDSVRTKPQKQVITKIIELVAALEYLQNTGQSRLAYGRLLRYTAEELDTIYNYLRDPKNIEKDNYIDAVLEAQRFIESYQGMVENVHLTYGQPEQKRDFDKVHNMLYTVSSQINPALEAYIKHQIKNKTSKDITEEELQKMLKEGYDISMADYYAGDLATSREPLLALANKLYKDAVQQSLDKTDEFKKKALEMGRKLSAVFSGKVDFSFMLNYKDGEFTGRYVQALGQAYYDVRKKFYNLLKDSKGEIMKYIPISNLDDASPEDLDFNIELYKKKQQFKQFSEYEVMGAAGVEDGEYHQIDPEFARLRASIEEYDTSIPVGSRPVWRPRLGIDLDAYDRYRETYYNKVEYWGPEFEEDGTYRGRVTKKIGWFLKKQYIKPKLVTKSGQDLRDPKYIKLLNPTNEKERVMLEFYNWFNEEMKSSLEKLPLSEQQKMLGKVARVKNNYLDALSKKNTSLLKRIVTAVRDWFDLTPPIYSMQRLTDENGELVDSLPILYTGDLKNQNRVAAIEKEIQNLKDEYSLKKSITTDDFKTKLKKLEQALNIEKAKVDVSEINIDLVENLIAFKSMSEKFEQMSNIESSMQAIAKVVENKQYYVTDAKGTKFISKGSDKLNPKDVFISGSDSRSLRRLKKFYKMVYYNNDEYDSTTTAQVVNKLMQVTSLKGMGLNVFGGINNLVMGHINNTIEAFGGVYFDADAYKRAEGAFVKDYLPGAFTGAADSAKDKITPEEYKEIKPYSKYQALVDQFRVVRKFQSDSGRVDAFGWAYIIQETGEYAIQSKTGLAVLMSKKYMLKHKDTGETLSIYDAYNFDPNTKTLSLKPGYELPQELKHNITDYIYEVNKQIHGNYAWEDRMVIQQHWLGQLAAQFHKWIYPLFKARFQTRYEDATLGTMEGRYRSLVALAKYAYDLEGNIKSKVINAWKNLDDIQRRNNIKNLVELGFLLTSFVAVHGFKLASESLGSPDDDDWWTIQLKRLSNFMRYQSTRQATEILTFVPIAGTREQWQMAKNPVATLGTVKDYMEFIWETVKLPFPPYTDAYYERGNHKGSLRAWKELNDVVPILNQLNRWESFDTVREFYIK
jgi:hypothetical protein